jgi:exonuclease SbcD
VEEVFERRLAQEELDDARRTRLNELFNEALHTLNNEEPHA